MYRYASKKLPRQQRKSDILCQRFSTSRKINLERSSSHPEGPSKPRQRPKTGLGGQHKPWNVRSSLTRHTASLVRWPVATAHTRESHQILIFADNISIQAMLCPMPGMIVWTILQPSLLLRATWVRRNTNVACPKDSNRSSTACTNL